MSGQPGYWIWDERHQDYYHARFNTGTGKYDYEWRRNSAAPRTASVPGASNPTYPAPGQNPPPQPPPQPVDPYGAASQNTNLSRNYAYSQSHRGTDLGSLTRDFGNLTTTAGYGAYSPSVTAPPRAPSLAQAPISPYSTSYQHTRSVGGSNSSSLYPDPRVRGYSMSNAHTPHLASSGTRAGSEYGTSPASNAIDPMPPFSSEIRPSTQYSSRHGSSLDAQTSSASYQDSRIPGSTLTIPKHPGRLDPEDFFVRNKPHRFFVEGKVFIKLHTEDAGNAADSSSFGFSTVAYAELAYSQLRRFVVVKSRPKEFYSLCIPILTYRGQGAAKKGVDQSAHTIIYTGSRPPSKQANEHGMKKAPLRVIPSKPEEKLDPMSRVNLGKTYTVEWNTKVKEIGDVDHKDLVNMKAYWKQLLGG